MGFIRNRLALRLALLFGAIVLGSIAVIFFYVVPQLESTLREEKLRSLTAATRDYSRPVIRAIANQVDGQEARRRGAHRVRRRQRARHPAGRRHAQRRRADPLRALGLDDPAQITDLQFQVASDAVATRHTTTGWESSNEGRVGEAARPLRFNKRISHVIVFSAPLTDVQSNVALIRRRILVAGLIALAVALLGGYAIARWLTLRVRRLERAAEKVSRGDFSGSIPIDSGDELGQLAMAFNTMQGQLAQLDSARKRFIAVASHELRTPLFSLGGFVELLQDEELDEDTRQEFLGQMRDQVDRLTVLATELLDLSRLEAGSLELRPEQVDLGELARSVAGEFTPAVSRHHSQVSLDLPEREISVTCDPERVAQIVRILHRQCAHPHARRHGHRGEHGARERTGPARGPRLGPGHQAHLGGAHLRALLHVRRRPGIGPGTRDRPRPGRADVRAPRRRPHARRDDLHARAARMRARGAVLAGLLASLVAAGCGGGGDGQKSAGAGAQTTERVRTVATTKVQVVEGMGEKGGFDARGIYQRESPGVVTVVSVFDGGAIGGASGGGDARGLGSGFVISDDGEIATNAHVVTIGQGSNIQRAKAVYVQFGDGNEVPARILGYDPNSDIALLRVDPAGLKLDAAATGLERAPDRGRAGGGDRQPVRRAAVALGRRDLGAGPHDRLADARSRSTARSRPTRPSTTATRAGRSSTPTGACSGSTPRSAPPAAAGRASASRCRWTRCGARSRSCARTAACATPTSASPARRCSRSSCAASTCRPPTARGSRASPPTGPADKAGLRAGDRKVRFQVRDYYPDGDIIAAIAGHAISSSEDISRAIAGLRPGQTIPIVIYRGKDRRTVRVKLGDRPNYGSTGQQP